LEQLAVVKVLIFEELLLSSMFTGAIMESFYFCGLTPTVAMGE